jgi:hypothetical protein
MEAFQAPGKKRLPKSKLERATAPSAPEAALAKSPADKEAARRKQARVIAERGRRLHQILPAAARACRRYH